MKAFLLCTATHRELLTRFLLPSIPDDIELEVTDGCQHSVSGAFMEDGWLESMREKVCMLADAVDSNPGECLVHLDADVQFFVSELEPILMRYLARADFVGQCDGGETYCGGLFAFRANGAVRALFTRMLEIMDARGVHDQEALNLALRQSGVRAELLHDDHFWSPHTHWQPGMQLDLSPCAVAHHANWCVGVNHKLIQLEEGRRLHALWRGLERHGSAAGGGWMLQNSLVEDSVIYSAGVGVDISFEISLIDRYSVTIHAFDPAPGAIEYASEFAGIDSRFKFYPVGLSARTDESGSANLQENPTHLSCSWPQVENSESGAIEVPLKSIRTIMRELGHERIDLFKLDIAGAEYELIEHQLDEEGAWLPRQLLVGFRDLSTPGLADRRSQIIQRLLSRGYELSYQEGAEFSFRLGDRL